MDCTSLQKNLIRQESHSAALSFAQERLWLLDQLNPGNPTYNLSVAIHLKGLLDVRALDQSLGEIVRRHEALRTTFSAVDGQSLQVIASDLKWTLAIVSLRELSETERQQQSQRLITESVQQSFDLATGPLLRAVLQQLSEIEHILLLTIHEIVADDWSLGVLLQELATLYEAFANGLPSPLVELPSQYADFAIWQRECLLSEVLESQLAYWKQQLGGELPVLELPTDRPRPPVQTYRGARQSLNLPNNLTDALKSLSQQSGVTLFMTLLAAFNTLLYRHTGQEDIIVGSAIANRNQLEVKGLIGLFANNLVMRTNLSENPSFRELLGRVQEVVLSAYSHQDLPFEKLVGELQTERHLSHSPLIQVMFVLQSDQMPALEFSGLSVNAIEVESKTAKFDLTLELQETSEGMNGWFEYNADLFDADTISRMIGHWQVLLEGVVTQPNQQISHLPILTEAERHQLLIEWNDTAINYPKYKCTHHLFEEQVKRTPNAIALVFENQQLTYQQLNRRANQLAHHLQKLGVKPEVAVGICLERSLDMLVALLAIFKAGGAYIPLDPNYPEERLAFMLEDSQLSLLLTTEKILQNSLSASVKALPKNNNKQSPINPEQLTVICLDKDWEIINQENPENLESNIEPTNLAYLIYTSGSTGKPKGVQITHRNVVNFLTTIQQQLQLTNQDSLLSVTTLSFDIAVLEIFLPLTVGAKVILVSREVAMDGLQLLQKLHNFAATVMQATPATWRMLLEAGWRGNTQLKILCGGEALPQNLAKQLCQRGAEVWNLYGPTETTIWSTIHRIDQQEVLVTIGRPIGNTQIYILDKYLQPVPVGVPGELYIGGASLARGYLHRPELTKEKFIHNPFSSDSESRLYKTGDLARYLSDGEIEYLGRIDYQIKLRGYRIELAEIEAVLSQHPTIEKTVVIVRDDFSGDKCLVAYIVSKFKEALTNEELRRFLKEKLPYYMVPGVFVFLDTLPLTPNGKIDRRALPAPDLTARHQSEVSFVAAQNELELQLTKIWEKVLGINPIGIKDNFFTLGGHSLIAVRLVSEIEKVCQKKLPLSTFFQKQTIEELAVVLEQTESSQVWESLVMIQPGSQTKPPLFCIHAVWGNVLFYRKLGRYLDKEQPFYALQAKGLDGKQAPLTSVSKMASNYIHEIKTIQPNGPYFLGGFSFGGLLAFEIAQQLHTQGDEIRLLAIFDTVAPNVIEFNSNSSDTKLQTLSDESFLHFPRLVKLNFKDQVAYIWKRLHWHLTVGKVNFFYKFYLQYIKRSLLELRLLEVYQANNQARKSYVVQVYPGILTLFCSDETVVQCEDDPELGWGQIVTGGVEIHNMPGTIHTTLMEEPGVQVLAEKLQTCLDNAQTSN
ncbi:MAG: amino acid adenylation domain-containing protein [Nostoc sp. NOS(2021)]|uniref:non-ribosomal peptide synthetase n=1 Tax=Nostoc sp. NOS(2021) TaxID=2815407 RepID=UPI0025CC2707|nr:non-ribosomal peptide synthetase [Nostoc sp. NOS(2021)]MBN3895575.1 amino acid adenylation domain-containing protein [Nostoc sp. NOS(2021)]